jgi:hypothetical protein
VKAVSPETVLILPYLKDPESLGVQLETVRLSGASTHNLVENLVQMVLKLSEDVQQLRKDNEYHLNKIATSAPTPPVPAMKSSFQESSN